MVANVTAQRERTFAEVKRLTLAGLSGPELLRRTAERLQRVVPFEAYCASTADPASNLITHGIAGGDLDGSAEAEDAFLDRVYFEEDLPQMVAMLRERRAVQLLSESTGGALDRSPRYREILRPQGLGHQLGAAFVDGSLWGSMELMRRASGPDFNGGEVALVRRVAPHVGAGLKAAALRSRALTEQDGPDLPGVLNLDRRGRLLSYTPAAGRWLEDLHPGWHEDELPVPVRMVAGVLRRSLVPRSDRETDLSPRVRVRGRSGRWITLYGSLTEPRDGRGGETIVVVEPASAEDVTWLNMASYGLSLREADVVRLVARGLSTRRMSESLFISEYTVQRHLQNAFEKVGVRSRTELLKRVFFENLLPGIAPG